MVETEFSHRRASCYVSGSDTLFCLEKKSFLVSVNLCIKNNSKQLNFVTKLIFSFEILLQILCFLSQKRQWLLTELGGGLMLAIGRVSGLSSVKCECECSPRLGGGRMC